MGTDTFIKKFCDIGITDAVTVGDKNAGLGELHNNLFSEGIVTPKGFAITTAAFSYFMEYNGLEAKLDTLLLGSKFTNASGPQEIASKARSLFMNAKFPTSLEKAIVQSYAALASEKDAAVAVRSSIFREGLEERNFAGQFDTYLNIKGPFALMYAVKCCFASLYNDAAVKFREDNNITHNSMLLSVGIQQMVRSDLASSGYGFISRLADGTNLIHIMGFWGLGRQLPKDAVDPDAYIISQDTSGKSSLIQKSLGSKTRMLVYNDHAAGTNSTTDKTTPREMRAEFVLTDDEALTLAGEACVIARHYDNSIQFEWAKDGQDNRIYIMQAHAVAKNNTLGMAENVNFFRYLR